MRDEILIRRGEYFVADSDKGDLGGRVERGDVGGDPRFGGGEVGDRWYVTGGESNDEGDARVCECADEIWVGVEELDAVDVGVLSEEVCDLRRGREVVGDGAVVDANGEGCGRMKEEEEEGGEEKRGRHRFCFFEERGRGRGRGRKKRSVGREDRRYAYIESRGAVMSLRLTWTAEKMSKPGRNSRQGTAQNFNTCGSLSLLQTRETLSH